MKKGKRKITHSKKRSEKKPKDSWFKHTSFAQSFTKRKNILYAGLLDAVHYAVLYVIFMLMDNIMFPLLTRVQSVSPLFQDINALTETQFIDQIEPLTGVLFKLKLYLLLLFIIVVINWTFFKGLIWKILKKRKQPWNYYIKLFGFNAVYFAIVLYASYQMAIRYLKPDSGPFVMLLLILPVFAYISLVFHAVFDGSLKSFIKALKAMLRFWHFIIPLMLTLIIGYLIFILTNLITSLPALLYSILVVVLILALVAWARQYFSLVIQKVEKTI